MTGISGEKNISVRIRQFEKGLRNTDLYYRAAAPE